MGPPKLSVPLLCVGGGALLGSYLRVGPQHIGARWPWAALVLAVAGLAWVNVESRDAKSSIPSPRITVLPALSEHELASLAYPPDAFPGARDVDSPYGTLRVYEWGPNNGGKVLFIHGISTPCLALGGVAQGLVERGYRVMLFDLWGRGFSDFPQDLPQDMRLFSSAIFIALTSSPLCWTGSSSFTLVGYSLGGGIATSFTSYFPSLVSNLILIAPSGLMRKEHISKTSKLLYSVGLLPEYWIEILVKRRLEGDPSAAVAVKSKPITNVAMPIEEELPSLKQTRGEGSELLCKLHPELVARDAVAWQVKHHRGFIKAFVSSIRNGPLHGQRARWRIVANNFTIIKSATQGKKDEGARRAYVLVICGDQDPIVIQEEIFEDASRALGSDNVELRSCDAGHELPMTHSSEVVGIIGNFLQGV